MNTYFLNYIINNVNSLDSVLLLEVSNFIGDELLFFLNKVNNCCIATESMLLKNRLYAKYRSVKNFHASSLYDIPNMPFTVLVVQRLSVNVFNILHNCHTIRTIITVEDIPSNFMFIDNFTILDKHMIVVKPEVNNEEFSIDDFNRKMAEAKAKRQAELAEQAAALAAAKAVEVAKAAEIIEVPGQKAETLFNCAEHNVIRPNKASFFTVNYNTSKLINLLIKSIHKCVKSFEYDIWVLDNSDKEPLVLENNWNDVHILDNTKGQLINYEEELKKYTDVRSYSERFVGFISLKHALAIQFGLNYDLINDNFILCDSDVILTRDIDFIDETSIAIGFFEEKSSDFTRLAPYLCYINKKLLRSNNVSYFNRNFMHGCIDENGKIVRQYDTGTYFLKRCKELSLKVDEVNIYDYCIHFKSQSRSDRSASKGPLDIDETAKTYGLLDYQNKRYSFFIVNYNTSDLMNLLIESIHKNVKSVNYDIWIFDNSDKEKLTLTEDNKKNVKILDNTHDKIIDYRKQIDKYCAIKYKKEHPTSFGVGEFPSARHAIAIQYAIDNAEKIGMSEEIILCDSDVIIFKDLDFLKPNMLYQGFETHFEDSGTSDDRIKPCLCHVNSRLMRERRIRFFDPNKMLGCIDSNGGVIKKFDTGSSFYYAAHKFIDTQHVDIFKYCCHLIAQSHKDRGKHNIQDLHKKFIENEFPPFTLNRIDFTSRTDKIYNEIKERYGIKDPKAKNVIYMCITGGYDNIYEQKYYDFDNFDYICFTNSSNLKSNNWKIVDISGIEKLLNLNDSTRIARFFKTHPHLFFEKYERSIWIDGNIKIIEKNLKDNFLSLMDEGNYLLTAEHPYITNVYEEIAKCIELRKDTIYDLDRIKNFLKNEKFNDKGQHVQTGIILRNHKHIECIAIMERWWEMIRDFSKRDQTSFNYVFRKMNGRFLTIPWKVMATRFFNVGAFHKKNVTY